MKVCDVVLNSVWYDPRVRKQINEYLANGIDLCCVGMKCERYDEEKVSKIPCPTTIVSTREKYIGRQKNIFKKLARERSREKDICDAIVAYKPDVIHANDLDALIPAYRASKILKCGLIFDSHEIYVENFFTGGHKMYAAMLKMQERHIVKRVDKMVCVSHAAAEYFAKEYKIPKPTVITNCSLKAEQCISEEKNAGFEIINHGQFYEGRGYDIMASTCELIKDYPEIKLAVRGFGRIENALRKIVAECSNSEQFVFYPKVTVQELIPMASRSHVGVAITEAICLNFKLSVSNKLFEYASAGLPVIMSDIPEHRYLNDKYEFGIIIPENTPKAFAEAVIKLYTDKELYARCAENAKKLSEEVNWENEFARLIEFERSIVE